MMMITVVVRAPCNVPSGSAFFALVKVNRGSRRCSGLMAGGAPAGSSSTHLCPSHIPPPPRKEKTAGQGEGVKKSTKVSSARRPRFGRS